MPTDTTRAASRLREALERYIVALDRVNDVNDTDNTVDEFEAAVDNLETVARAFLAIPLALDGTAWTTPSRAALRADQPLGQREPVGEALDVETLARALMASLSSGWIRLTPSDPVEEWCENARTIAAEYAALRAAANPEREDGK